MLPVLKYTNMATPERVQDSMDFSLESHPILCVLFIALEIISFTCFCAEEPMNCVVALSVHLMPTESNNFSKFWRSAVFFYFANFFLA